MTIILGLFHILCYIVFISSSVTSQTVTQCISPNVTIRDETKSFVWEGFWSDDLVRLRASPEDQITYGSAQMWRFQQSARIGLFNIILVYDEKALDLSKDFDQLTQTYNITTDILTDRLTQQWLVGFDGALINAAAPNYTLGVANGNLTDLNHIVVGPQTEAIKFFLIH